MLTTPSLAARLLSLEACTTLRTYKYEWTTKCAFLCTLYRVLKTTARSERNYFDS